MRTTVNILLDLQRLVNDNQKLQEANRAALLERQQQQRTSPRIAVAQAAGMPPVGRGIGLHLGRRDEPIGPLLGRRKYNTFLLVLRSDTYELNEDEDSDEYGEAWYYNWDGYVSLAGNDLGPSRLSQLWNRVFYKGQTGGTGYVIEPKAIYFVVDLSRASSEPPPASTAYELEFSFYLDVASKPDEVPEPSIPGTATVEVFPCLLNGADRFDPAANAASEIQRLSSLGVDGLATIDTSVLNDAWATVGDLRILVKKGTFTLQ